MKIIKLSVFFAIVILNGSVAKSQNLNSNIEIQFSAEQSQIIKDLEKIINHSHSEKIKKLPEDIKVNLTSCNSFSELSNLPIESQSWLYDNVQNISEEKMGKLFERLNDEIKQKGDYIHGDDISEILKHSFWCILKDRPINVEEKIRSSIIYWREHKVPAIKFSPLGRGEIRWIWTLAVRERLHGTIHVGLDLEKRTFICYEHNIGLYFPEGDILNRIYRDIVRNPQMDGNIWQNSPKAIGEN